MIKFVYVVEGEPFVGDISDYAKAYEHCYYSGLELQPWIWLTTNDPEEMYRTAPQRTSTGYDENDYAVVTFAYGEDEANITLDGRA